MNRRQFLKSGAVVTGAATAALAAPTALRAQERAVIRVGLGPQQPTQADTYRVWEPIYRIVTEQVGAELDLNVANDWAGISTALANQQIDVAQMGPCLARNNGGARPIDVMLVNGQPIYRAIIVGRPGLEIESFPEGAEGLLRRRAGRHAGGSGRRAADGVHRVERRGAGAAAVALYRLPADFARAP